MNKSFIVALVVIGLIAIAGLFTPFGQKFQNAVMTAGSTTANCGGSVTCFTELAANYVYLGNPSSPYSQTASVGTCASATSTLFAVVNPFNSTSTASIRVASLGQATTSLMSIGTTTTSTGLTSVSASLVNAASIATTTNSTILSGITTPLGTGQVSSGSGTITKIVVGPSEYVSGYATSTATGAGALSYTPGLTCTYKIVWEN